MWLASKMSMANSSIDNLYYIKLYVKMYEELTYFQQTIV